MTTRRPEDEYRRLQREQDNLLEENLGHRAGVYRRALFFAPSAVACLVVFSIAFLALLGGNIGALLGSAILGVIAFALSYEALAALRDLGATPIDTTGAVERIWTKSKFRVFGKSGYIPRFREVWLHPGQGTSVRDPRRYVDAAGRRRPHPRRALATHQPRGRNSPRQEQFERGLTHLT